MKYFLTFLLFLSGLLNAQDTFSIVAVDPETGEVGGAGASCIDDSDCGGCGGVIIINGLLPGKGAINSQAYVCLPNVNLSNGLTQMSLGLSPTEIIAWLQDNDDCFSQGYNPAYRQYGIVDLDDNNDPRSAAFTGANTDPYSNHLTGPNYAVQGNILLGQEILDEMEANFLNTTGSLAEKLMAALQGANVPGADTRCLSQGISSKSAFIRVAKPGDSAGNYYLELNVPEVPGGVEPIDSLQNLFDAWKLTLNTQETGLSLPQVILFPNPAGDLLNISVSSGPASSHYTLIINNPDGKVSLTRKIQNLNQAIDLSDLPRGNLYFLELRNDMEQRIFIGKLLH